MAINVYCTTTECKAGLADTDWTAAYDTFLATAITRASRLIDKHTSRKPGAYFVDTDVVHYFSGKSVGGRGSTVFQSMGFFPSYYGGDQLWIGELATAPTAVAVAETGIADSSLNTGGTYTPWNASDYYLWPYNAADLGIPFMRLDINRLSGTKFIWYTYPKAVKITGKFGYSTTVPDDIKEATITQVVRWFKRSQQAFTDVGINVALGETVYRQALDPQVIDLLTYYRKMAI